MNQALGTLARRFALGAIALAITAASSVRADWSNGDSAGGHSAPVYQRRAFESMHGGSRRHGHGRPWSAPPVSAGWFQRPYPYHLDYYRMRYGGSYAPYFGNLYGPPQVVTAPPYYGPYFGEYGYPNGFGYNGAYGGDGAPAGYPPGNNGPMHHSPAPQLQPTQPAAEPTDADLPTPSS